MNNRLTLSLASVLQAVCGRSDIHKTAEVPGLQPCIRAGGRSTALLPVNQSLSSLAFRYLMLSPAYLIFDPSSTLFLANVSPPLIVL